MKNALIALLLSAGLVAAFFDRVPDGPVRVQHSHSSGAVLRAGTGALGSAAVTHQETYALLTGNTFLIRLAELGSAVCFVTPARLAETPLPRQARAPPSPLKRPA